MMEEKVYIVGSGPGDPGLLTVKAYRLLKECDVLLYDRLVTDEILEIVPEKCEKIYVGKDAEKRKGENQAIRKFTIPKNTVVTIGVEDDNAYVIVTPVLSLLKRKVTKNELHNICAVRQECSERSRNH